MTSDQREVVSLHDLRGTLARIHFHAHTPREHLANVRELGYLETLVRDLLRAEVAASRIAVDGQRARSWRDIAVVLEVWPNAAYERFSSRPPPAG